MNKLISKTIKIYNMTDFIFDYCYDLKDFSYNEINYIDNENQEDERKQYGGIEYKKEYKDYINERFINNILLFDSQHDLLPPFKIATSQPSITENEFFIEAFNSLNVDNKLFINLIYFKDSNNICADLINNTQQHQQNIDITNKDIITYLNNNHSFNIRDGIILLNDGKISLRKSNNVKKIRNTIYKTLQSIQTAEILFDPMSIENITNKPNSKYEVFTDNNNVIKDINNNKYNIYYITDLIFNDNPITLTNPTNYIIEDIKHINSTFNNGLVIDKDDNLYKYYKAFSKETSKYFNVAYYTENNLNINTIIIDDKDLFTALILKEKSYITTLNPFLNNHQQQYIILEKYKDNLNLYYKSTKLISDPNVYIGLNLRKIKQFNSNNNIKNYLSLKFNNNNILLFYLNKIYDNNKNTPTHILDVNNIYVKIILDLKRAGDYSKVLFGFYYNYAFKNNIFLMTNDILCALNGISKNNVDLIFGLTPTTQTDRKLILYTSSDYNKFDYNYINRIIYSVFKENTHNITNLKFVESTLFNQTPNINIDDDNYIKQLQPLVLVDNLNIIKKNIERHISYNLLNYYKDKFLFKDIKLSGVPTNFYSNFIINYKGIFNEYLNNFEIPIITTSKELKTNFNSILYDYNNIMSIYDNFLMKNIIYNRLNKYVIYNDFIKKLYELIKGNIIDDEQPSSKKRKIKGGGLIRGGLKRGRDDRNSLYKTDSINKIDIENIQFYNYYYKTYFHLNINKLNNDDDIKKFAIEHLNNIYDFKNIKNISSKGTLILFDNSIFKIKNTDSEFLNNFICFIYLTYIKLFIYINIYNNSDVINDCLKNIEIFNYENKVNNTNLTNVGLIDISNKFLKFLEYIYKEFNKVLNNIHDINEHCKKFIKNFQSINLDNIDDDIKKDIENLRISINKIFAHNAIVNSKGKTLAPNNPKANVSIFMINDINKITKKYDIIIKNKNNNDSKTIEQIFYIKKLIN